MFDPSYAIIANQLVGRFLIMLELLSPLKLWVIIMCTYSFLYEGSAVVPPEYPTRVLKTPGVAPKTASHAQKQPMPKVALRKGTFVSCTKLGIFSKIKINTLSNSNFQEKSYPKKSVPLSLVKHAVYLRRYKNSQIQLIVN